MWASSTVTALGVCGNAWQHGEPANFFVYYEIDDDESKHALSLKDYGHKEVMNAWVLLEAAPEEEAML